MNRALSHAIVAAAPAASGVGVSAAAQDGAGALPRAGS